MDDELRALTKQWVRAERDGDSATLAGLITDTFVGVGPFGFMLDRAQWLARYTSGDLANSAFDWAPVREHAYGDTVVVHGVQTQQTSYRGRPNDGEFRGMQVFVRDGGRWKLAAMQLSALVEAARNMR